MVYSKWLYPKKYHDIDHFVQTNKKETPALFLIAFNKETKVMGLQVCRAKTRGSFKFSKPEGEQKGIVQVMNKNLKETLLHIMSEWDESKRYKV